MEVSKETLNKVRLIQAQVRPRILIIVAVGFFVFGFADIPVRQQVVDTFQWAFVGGIAWYFPERGVMKILDWLKKRREGNAGE